MRLRFPLLLSQEERRAQYPTTVDYAFVKQYAVRLYSNHGQSVQRLAERGGLSPLELYGAANEWAVSRIIFGPHPSPVMVRKWLLDTAGGE